MNKIIFEYLLDFYCIFITFRTKTLKYRDWNCSTTCRINDSDATERSGWAIPTPSVPPPPTHSSHPASWITNTWVTSHTSQMLLNNVDESVAAQETWITWDCASVYPLASLSLLKTTILLDFLEFFHVVWQAYMKSWK